MNISTKTCSVCGANLPENTRFCPNCGASTEDLASAASSAESYTASSDSIHPYATSSAQTPPQNPYEQQNTSYGQNFNAQPTYHNTPQPPYQPPSYPTYSSPYNSPYHSYPQRPQSNGKATAGLVLGILSIAFSCCYGFGLIFAIIGLVLSILARKEQKSQPSGIATGGLVCSIIGLILSVLMLLFLVFCIWVAYEEDAGYNGNYFTDGYAMSFWMCFHR